MLELEYNKIILALCIWREARGEPEIAKRGVAHCVLNRVMDQRWPDTPVSVILQAKQFSSFNAGDPNASKMPWPSDQAWRASCAVAADPGDDPTNGANHYHSYSNPSSYPHWADPEKLTTELGAFKFYKL